MKITVAGVGYVGLSLAVLLAQNHEVTAITTTDAKAEKLNKFISPIQDDEIERFFREERGRVFKNRLGREKGGGPQKGEGSKGVNQAFHRVFLSVRDWVENGLIRVFYPKRPKVSSIPPGKKG